jgi:hypothetical protein
MENEKQGTLASIEVGGASSQVLNSSPQDWLALSTPILSERASCRRRFRRRFRRFRRHRRRHRRRRRQVTALMPEGSAPGSVTFKLELGPATYGLYTHSYLGFGQVPPPAASSLPPGPSSPRRCLPRGPVLRVFCPFASGRRLLGGDAD